MRILLFLIIFPFSVLSQNPVVQSESIHRVCDSVIFFGHCDAQFPGGLKALKAFITEHTSTFELNWSDSTNTKRAYVSFVIEATGEITEVNVTRSINESIDNQILCLMERMPKWTPACKEGGIPVRSRCRMPITFIRGS